MYRKYCIWLTVILGFILLSFSISGLETIKDFLSVGSIINFSGENYSLKWSSNPSTDYYKQEYLRKDDILNKYEKMLIVEAIKGGLTVDQAANIKIRELENWKKSNPVVNYQRFDNKNTRETIIEFVISDGKSIYEWNVYKYHQQQNKTDKYMVLYAYSYRNYVNEKDGVKEFFGFVEENRIEMINKIRKLGLPEVNAAK